MKTEDNVSDKKARVMLNTSKQTEMRATGFQTVESSPLVGSLVSPQVEVTEVSRDKLAEAVADAAVEGNDLCLSVADANVLVR